MKKEHTNKNKKAEQIKETQENTLQQEDQISQLEEENQKLKEELLRTLAESENIKKRCAAEIEKNNKYAISSFAKDLLSVADNLERALNAVTKEDLKACQGLVEGVELTQKELTHVFEKFGISKMDIIGKPFDPNFHQVVQQIDDASKPAGTIVAELQTGYMINGRILREAMVVVNKA